MRSSVRNRAVSTSADRLRSARRDAGFKTATAAAEALGINLSTYTQHENGTRAYEDDAAISYARKFKTTPEWLLFGRGARTVLEPYVPLVGFVGANPEGTVLFATGQENFDAVPPPPTGSMTARALEVRGHSMPFFAEDGAIIYFDHQRPSPTPELLRHMVVVQLDTDEVLVKRLMRGSSADLFDLESISGPTRHDARISWVAPVVAVIPPLEARRLVRRSEAS